MAMELERSKPPLHNFTMPCGLKWGNQRSYRSSKSSTRRRVQPPTTAMAQHRRSKETCVAKRARVGESGQKFDSDVDNGIVVDEERRRVVAVDVEEPSSPLSPVREGGSIVGFSFVVVYRIRSRFVGEGRRRRLLASSSTLGLGFVVDCRICHIVSRFQTCSRLMVQD
nr:uncharacterized protein LOC109156702 [Ipomoea batatas]